MSAELILNLINEVLDSNLKLEEKVIQEQDSDGGKSFNAEEFYKTALAMFKPPTELAGKLDTEERQFFQKYISNNIIGKTLPEKIEQLNVLMESETDVEADDTPLNYILSSLGALKILQETIDDFNESTAGFTFEAFLSGLLGGKQVTDKVGGTLPIEDCMFFVDPKTGEGGQPVSLKLLTGTGDSTLVKGSIKNLLGFFQREDIAPIANDKGIEYIVAVKFSDKGLGIYSFNIRPNDFFYWVDEKNFDFSKLRPLPDEEPLNEQEEGEQDKELKDAVERFKKGVAEVLPMMGLPREFEPNLSQLKTGNLGKFKETVIPFPPAPKGQSKKAKQERLNYYKSLVDGALSDEGKAAYEKFLKMPKESDRPSYEKETKIPQELIQAYSENPEDLETIKQIAKIVGKRYTKLKDAIEKVSDLEDISVIPLMRYAGKFVKRTYKRADVVDYLNFLGSSKDPKQIIKWSKLLTEMQTEPQFKIALRRVITEGENYGTMTFDKSKIFQVIEAYADVLKVQVAPVYRSFAFLNQSINAYFIENRPGSAAEASQYAKELQEDVDKLPKIKEYAPPSPKIAGTQTAAGLGMKGLGSPLKPRNESKEFDDQLQLLMKEVFGR